MRGLWAPGAESFDGGVPREDEPKDVYWVLLRVRNYLTYASPPQ